MAKSLLIERLGCSSRVDRLGLLYKAKVEDEVYTHVYTPHGRANTRLSDVRRAAVPGSPAPPLRAARGERAAFLLAHFWGGWARDLV